MDHTDGNDINLATLRAMIERARPDQYAVRVKGKTRWEYVKRSGAITDVMLRAHLNGGPYLGMYLMSAGSDTTQTAVLDLDDHDQVMPWPDLQAKARDIIAAASGTGLSAWSVRSGGGHGAHLFFSWDTPQPAAAVRAVLRSVLAAVGLKDGTAGLPDGQVEVFPKQDRLEATGAESDGSLIALPFGRASVPLGDDLEPRDAPALWVTSAPPPPPIARGQGSNTGRRAAPRTVDLAVVADALGHLSADDYDDWLRVGMALKLDAGDAGFACWNEWSARSPKYRGEADLRSRWKSFRRDGTGGAVVGLDAVYARARDAGWTGGNEIAPPFSDEALALAFAEDHADTLRFTEQWGKWNHWDGARWRPDDTLAVLDLARSHCRTAAGRANKKQAQIASARASSATIALARADRRLAMRPDQWDAHPWLLATPGGTVDLRTGILRAADPGEHLTRATAVAPGGECPLWLRTVGQIFQGDADRIAFVQRWFGYCLTGSVREEKLVFLHGAGGNGKGTLVETIAGVAGDHVVVVPTTALMQTRHPNHPTEIAKLCGVRLAIGSEVAQGARWNVEEIKKLTGADKLTARFMREDFFDFAPSHKLTVSGNNLPGLGHVEVAITRRMLLLEFRVSFAGAEDTALKESLRAEGPGILRWLIDGCLDWQRNGLGVPASVRADTDDYLRKMDDVALWVDECCAREDDPTGRKASTAELLGSYQEWRERNGATWISAVAFTERLRAMGFAVDDRRNHGKRGVSGLRLVTPNEVLDHLERDVREGDRALF
ncbi:MAG: hypothetical protein HIU82_12510 [Proteobacteria bacterium]|nr:hypothetical protein [Pseudomonadota bacterium]